MICVKVELTVVEIAKPTMPVGKAVFDVFAREDGESVSSLHLVGEIKNLGPWNSVSDKISGNVLFLGQRNSYWFGFCSFGYGSLDVPVKLNSFREEVGVLFRVGSVIENVSLRFPSFVAMFNKNGVMAWGLQGDRHMTPRCYVREFRKIANY